jgi:hypothetical protein
MTTAVLKKNIAKLARESVREAVRAELMHVRASALPLVSPAEQRDIVRKHKKPSRSVARSVRVSF